jgi:hypothetical protein
MMKILTITKPAAAVLTLVLFAALSIWSTQPAQAADPLVKGAKHLAPVGEVSVLASGAEGDSLKTCIARIPKVASVGQRMLAKQTCAGEEETRKVIRSAPTF